MALKKPRALVSWSSGKDSAFSLHAVRERDELEVVVAGNPTFSEASGPSFVIVNVAWTSAWISSPRSTTSTSTVSAAIRTWMSGLPGTSPTGDSQNGA